MNVYSIINIYFKYRYIGKIIKILLLEYFTILATAQKAFHSTYEYDTKYI